MRISPRELDGLFRREARRRELDIRLRLLPAARIEATLCNIHRDRDEHPEPFTALDFLPVTEEEIREQQERESHVPTPEEIAMYKQRLFAGIKGGEKVK